jgi:hypothetical protein
VIKMSSEKAQNIGPGDYPDPDEFGDWEDEPDPWEDDFDYIPREYE